MKLNSLMPKGPFEPNGKKIALIGAGPASLTIARDLAPLGYEIHLYDDQRKGGGFMVTQIPAFRLPVEVLDEEVDYILDMDGIHTHFNQYVESMKEILDKDYDAVFIGTGAPRGKDLTKLPDVGIRIKIYISELIGWRVWLLSIQRKLGKK